MGKATFLMLRGHKHYIGNSSNEKGRPRNNSKFKDMVEYILESFSSYMYVCVYVYIYMYIYIFANAS